MSPMYLVWDADAYDDGQDADAAYEIHATPGPGRGWWEVARDAEHAAEIWANDNWAANDYPDTMECVVRSPDGDITRWKVAAENTVVFNVSPKKEE